LRRFLSLPNPLKLGVNVDHVATIRQQRHTVYPDPVEAALLAEHAGADGITLHLREDRRHIQERDVAALVASTQTKVNLEMAATDSMLAFACHFKPACCCLVPERRAELTTEGGLDVASQVAALTSACRRLASAGIEVSLFIEPALAQINAAKAVGAPTIELHTGRYAEADSDTAQEVELVRLVTAARHAQALGLRVNAGHGLHYQNVQAIARQREFYELNIGHSIVARALFVGFASAVTEMKHLMQTART
jgi:pyridoxine 5-phosphate synthase